MSAPPGPDPWGVVSPLLQQLRSDLTVEAGGTEPTTAKLHEEFRRRFRGVTYVRSEPGKIGFDVSSLEESEGARILKALADSWMQQPTEAGRVERWRALKLLYLARHEMLAAQDGSIVPVTSTEWVLLSREQQDVVNTPRLQTVFEQLGVEAAAENPIHLNEDWFGETNHWWPSKLQTTGVALEVVVIEGFIRMLEVSLALQQSFGGIPDLRDVRKLPGEGLREDRWLSTFARPWNGELAPETARDALEMVWHARKDPTDNTNARSEAGPWSISELELRDDGAQVTLAIETPMPLHPDRFASPPDLP